MKNLMRGLQLLGLLVLVSCSSIKSSPPTYDVQRFEEDIEAFEAKDASARYLPGTVLFTGSSSIRFWNGLDEDMGDIPCINRGFGGSTLPEVNLYYDRIITKFDPSVIVLYCGENDIAAGRPPRDVIKDYRAFVKMTKSKLPGARIIYLSMKPSPSRWHLWDQYKKGNTAIQKITKRDKDQYYIDVSKVMLQPNGEPVSAIFIEDMLHMNRSGYEGWQSIIQPVVQSIYNMNN
ncbi:MAG: hypothetical protein KJP00_01120 [Bacteroidia bacterium]|nr:hypothetical protein [Bacteroidia bacterium]